MLRDNEYRRRMEALAEVSRAIVSDLYLEDILKLMVMVAAEVLNSNIVSIMLLNEATGMLGTKATQAVNEARSPRSMYSRANFLAPHISCDGPCASLWK
ncbi:MAG: hypothetical protein H5T74_10860 [Actinobacteria bacterium]|nr:hypothetical protein [Actinomycetota bacterium]